MSMARLNLYGRDYDEYRQFLQAGNQYSILISKRLLLKPMVPLWLYFLALFLVPSGIFFAMVGLPSLILFSVFLVMWYPYWRACHVSMIAYTIFHALCLLLLKLASVLLFFLMEVLWIFCI